MHLTNGCTSHATRVRYGDESSGSVTAGWVERVHTMLTWLKREVVGARAADHSHLEAVGRRWISSFATQPLQASRYKLHVAPPAARTSAATYSSAWEAVRAAADALRPSATPHTAPKPSLAIVSGPAHRKSYHAHYDSVLTVSLSLKVTVYRLCATLVPRRSALTSRSLIHPSPLI